MHPLEMAGKAMWDRVYYPTSSQHQIYLIIAVWTELVWGIFDYQIDSQIMLKRIHQ